MFIQLILFVFQKRCHFQIIPLSYELHFSKLATLDQCNSKQKCRRQQILLKLPLVERILLSSPSLIFFRSQVSCVQYVFVHPIQLFYSSTCIMNSSTQVNNVFDYFVVCGLDSTRGLVPNSKQTLRSYNLHIKNDLILYVGHHR